jgi:hypothetical protein
MEALLEKLRERGINPDQLWPEWEICKSKSDRQHEKFPI